MTSGQKLGLKILKATTLAVWSFRLQDFFPQHLPKPLNAKLVNSQSNALKLWALGVLTATTSTSSECQIGELLEVSWINGPHLSRSQWL
jgi:hypothetical protein